jgi:hypothetical protein
MNATQQQAINHASDNARYMAAVEMQYDVLKAISEGLASRGIESAERTARAIHDVRNAIAKFETTTARLAAN